MIGQDTVDRKPELYISTDDFQRLFNIAGHAKDYWGVSQYLFTELERATLVKPWAIPPGVATMHSLIQFHDETSGRIQLAKLVYPHEAESTPGGLSVLTPAGAALLGLSEGDRISWPIGPGSVLQYQLIRVLYQPVGYH